MAKKHKPTKPGSVHRTPIKKRPRTSRRQLRDLMRTIAKSYISSDDQRLIMDEAQRQSE